jgi:CheY-like chemotaxis protein
MTRRILLIEDDQLSQDIITALLRGKGYAVDVAVDGFAGLEQARKQRYDVALIDYHLPEMDGYALGRLLREQRPDGAVPVLIGLTADSHGLAARRGSDAVFRAILPKPIKPPELFSAIERFCATPAQAVASIDAAPPAPDDARRSAAALWRSHGLATPPKAFVTPAPSSEQAAALSLCFELVGARQAQCVVLLERHGLDEAMRATKRDASAPLPIIGLSADHADICDQLFRVDIADSWRALAAALGAETTPVLAFPAASGKSAPDRPEPSPGVAAAARDAAEKAEPRSMAPTIRVAADLVAPSELRAVLLAGVQRPLDALRRDLAAREEVATDGGWRARHSARLDAILLAAGAIADALSPSRPSSSDAADFDPAELVGNALEMIRDSQPPGMVRFSCRSDNDMPGRLRGDVGRLSEIVLTLLDDACAGAAPVALVLHLSFDARQGSLVLRLGQVVGQASPEAGNSVLALLRGLRLTTLAGLVQLMGGRLDRQNGQVVLSLPAKPACATNLGPGADDPAHVLLVDDGATSGQLLTLLLTQRGHRVCRVGDSEGALVACRHARHDLAVFDLPNGAEGRLAALASLRGFRAAEPDIPAIVLTDAALADNEIRRRELLGAHILIKPFLPDALDDAVAACRPLLRQAEQQPAEPIDRKVRDSLVSALGEAAVARLTLALLQRIEGLVADAPELGGDGRSRLIELAGCASVLGLADLARHCAEPEPASIRDALRRLDDLFDAGRLSAA